MRYRYAVAAIFLAVILLPHMALAAQGGGGLPWDNALTIIQRDMTGPVPFAIGLIGMAIAGGTLIWAHEIGGFGRTIIYLTLVVSFMCAAPTVASALGIAGALVL